MSAEKSLSVKIFALIVGVILLGCMQTKTPNPQVSTAPTKSGTQIPTDQPAPIPKTVLAYPIDNFTTGVTKKPFGIYITPATSPVQPERFTGYHTGADIETSAAQKDTGVWVHAIADGKVELNRWVSGYGGVIIISFNFNGKTYSALYGHLNTPANLKVGDRITAKQTLTTLGAGYSHATDGERKHLHFSLRPGVDLDLRGYVQNKSELSSWIDPVGFFGEFASYLN